MQKPRSAANKAMLAAVICLAPGGFILGFTLAARHYSRKRARDTQQQDAHEGAEVETDAR